MRPSRTMSVSLQQLILGLSTLDGRPALGYRTEFRTFRWTYIELSRLIRATGDWLTRQGITRGDRVVFWGPNSPEWVGAFLACLAAGVVAVPLDLHSSADFVERVLDETDAKLLLRGRFQPHASGSHQVRFVDELEWEARPGQPERAEWPSVAPSDLAEIVYTSGTTARPRGVMLTHENLSANLSAIQPIVPPESFYRFVSLLPLSHAFEQMVGLFLPLSRGGEIVYVQAFKPSALVEALRHERPNVLVVVPRLLDFLQARIRGGLPEAAYTAVTRSVPIRLALRPIVRRAIAMPLLRQFGGRLRYVVVGGAPLDVDLERFWDALGLLVLQGYGLSEAAPVVSANTPSCHRVGSVGKPVTGDLVRIGEDEEVQVRGPNVTPGYYRRPDATAAALTDGWLRTGDLGRFDRQGFLFIRGRLKDLIVTSAGLKIYPEDVEAVLNRQPGVRDSVVLEWDGRIFAVLLLGPAVAKDPAEIVELANRQLNPVQQIQGWRIWPGSDFPRTPTLKVQKYLVREALASHLAAAASLSQPTDRLGRIVSDLAPNRPVTPAARLGIDLDLSSIDRLELITLLEEEFHIDLPETEVTGETTVQQLSQIVRSAGRQMPWHPRCWPLWTPLVELRDLVQRLIIFPCLHLIVRLSVHGCEHVANLRSPVIFAGNHVSHLDGPVVLMSLPGKLRRRTAVAALATFYFPQATNPLEKALHATLFNLATIFFNVFPVPRGAGFRDSLRNAGFLVEHNWNVLIFPEGTRNPEGHMQAFREGIGLLVSELKVPVVPFYVEGTFQMMPRGAWISRPGPVTVTFGEPMTFPLLTPWEITHQIEQAVSRLGSAPIAPSALPKR